MLGGSSLPVRFSQTTPGTVWQAHWLPHFTKDDIGDQVWALGGVPLHPLPAALRLRLTVLPASTFAIVQLVVAAKVLSANAKTNGDSRWGCRVAPACCGVVHRLWLLDAALPLITRFHLLPPL